LDNSGYRPKDRHYDISCGTTTVHVMPEIITYSEWLWEPQILPLDENRVLAVSVNYIPGSGDEEVSGDCDLVKIDCSRNETTVIHRNINCLPRLTLFARNNIVTTLLDDKSLLFLNSDFTRKKGFAVTGCREYGSITWTDDGSFIFIECDESLYQVGAYSGTAGEPR